MGIPGQAIGLPISRRNERVARHAPHGTLRSLRYDAVKSARVARLEFEARAPTHGLGKRIARRARQHRHANEADPENAECEEYECEVACQRAKCTRSLRCSLDVGNPGRRR